MQIKKKKNDYNGFIPSRALRAFHVRNISHQQRPHLPFNMNEIIPTQQTAVAQGTATKL